MKVFKGGLFCLGGPIWVFQRLKWLLLRSRGGRHPKFDNSLCIWSPHWDTIGSKNKYVWIRLQTGIKWLFLHGFEFSKDQKRSRKATNVFFYCQRSSKMPQHSSKIICCGVVSHLNVYIHLAYYNRYKCLETPQLHLLGKDILSQMSNLTFIM